MGASYLSLCCPSRRDGQTISTLAQQLGVDGPAVTNIVKRLEQSGLVERIRDSEDERVVKVFLTAEGLDLFHSVDPLVVQFHEQVLPGDQRQPLLEHLQHLIARVSTVAYLHEIGWAASSNKPSEHMETES